MITYTPQLVEGNVLGQPGVPIERNGLIASRLASVLPLVAAVYLYLAARAVILDQWAPAGQLAYLAGIGALGFRAALRRNRISLERMPEVVAGLCGLVLLQGLAGPTKPQAAAATVFLVVAGSSATFYSFRWHGAVIAVSIAAWYARVQPRITASEAMYWAVVLGATAVWSAATLQYRIWKAGKASAVAVVERPPEEGFQREHMELAVEGTKDGLWHWDLKSNEFHFSPSWAALLGFQPGEITPSPDEWMDRVHPGYLARLRLEMAAHLRGDVPQFRNEHRIRRRDGGYLWVLARATAVRDGKGRAVALAGSHCDFTPLMEAERRTLTDAFIDVLTELPNRLFLMGHLEKAVAERLARGAAAPLFAVMFLDLDRFKFINDTMGHDAGDQLLKAVAARLRSCARPEDVVARFGGDEFVLLLRDLNGPQDAMQVGARIVKALSSPFQIDGRSVQSGGSVGIALSRETFRDAEELLRFGDVAMYRAKSLRNGQVQLFNPGMMDNAHAQEQLRGELQSALGNDQLLLHYQPLIHMASGKIVAAEALIRWQRTPEKLLYPADFLPLAEKAGLMNEIGEWALRTACAENMTWQAANAAPVRMAVNLSASQLQQRDFPQLVERVLAATKLKPEWLELELTESVLMRSMEVAPATLKALKETGVRASIDDFGSGNASLNLLRHVPFHTMKLDRSFVAGVHTDPLAANIARGLITLAHNLDLSVVAEGVEENSQLRFLSGENCDQVQGFLVGRPIPGPEMLAVLRSGQSRLELPGETAAVPGLSRLQDTHQTPGGRTPRPLMR